jgi:hypothetical protein
MALPISVTYTFATATSAIPLSQLDANFTTVVNGINGIGNGTNSLSNVSITGGTIDGTTIGATTSSTGRFSTITATTGNITTVNATTLNAATHRSDATLTFQSNGTTTAMTIDTSQNVGIGTASPTQKLTVSGSASASNYYLGVAAGTYGVASDTSIEMYGSASLQTMLFKVNGNTERMRIDSSGNVGIGTSSPGFKTEIVCGYNNGLQVKDTTATIYGGFFTEAAGMALVTRSNNQLRFGTNDTTRMVIDPSGNVGIGTTNLGNNDQVGSARPLLVSGSDSSTTIAGSTAAIVIGNSNTTTSNTSQLSFAAITGASTTYYSSAAINCIFGARTNGQYPTGQLVFSTSTSLNSAPTEKMRLDNNGNLLVGTTTGTNTPSQGVTINTNSTIGSIGIGHANGTANGNSYLQFCYNGTSIGVVFQATTSSVTYQTTSDYRLKENVSPLSNGLQTVMSLKPVSYTWKRGGEEDDGFLAHELQQFVPHAVMGEKDEINEDGSIKPQGVDYGKIVVHLVAAIQELKAEIDALKGAK